MDEKLIQEKIAQLQRAVEQQNKQFRRGAVRTAIIMLLLVIFVFAYTSIIFNKLAELATPETMASMLIQQSRDQLPNLRSMLKEQMGPGAEMLAQKGVDSMEAMIPTIGEYSRNLISRTADEQLQKVKAKLLPKMERVLDEAIKTALAENKTGTFSDAVAQQAGDTASREIKKLLSEDFYASLSSLQGQLLELKVKDQKNLNRRDASERTAIASMLRLADMAQNESAESPVASVADIVSEIAEFLQSDITSK